jgi:uncharacterized membrane protein
MTIRNPAEWSADGLATLGHAVRAGGHALAPSRTEIDTGTPTVRRIGYRELEIALRRGLSDFGAYRSDVLLTALIYPLAGLVLARIALGYDLIPLIFPLASGFALVGPAAAASLYEMSRRRERGEPLSWTDAFRVVGNPSFGSILELGLVLVALFLLWLGVAMLLYGATLGPEMPETVGAFASALFTTLPGWILIVAGVGIGFLFALAVLATSVVSFPLLVDRRVGVRTAVATSLRAFAVNPGPMLAWGAIVAAALVLGALPLLAGLIVVIPVLGHATWHLYRQVVEPVQPATSDGPIEETDR